MLRIRLERRATNNCKERGVVYHPDFIIYDTDETEYRKFWLNIFHAPQTRLYTDGIQVIHVGWWQSWLQSIKGWFGFENRCAPEKVEMALAKIAYHGYTKGFNTPDILPFMPPLISPKYTSLISHSRNNHCSVQLQHLLMSYYTTHSEQIMPWYGPEQTVSSFGQTFNQEGLYRFIPSIDPQDNKVISKAISNLSIYSGLYLEANTHNYLKDSLFAQAYSENMLSRGMYTRALAWHEAIKYKYAKEFIDFFLVERNTIENALSHIVSLLEQLFESKKIEDRSQSVNYVVNHLDHSEQLTYLPENSQLKRAVVQNYLEEANAARKASSMTKLLFGNKLIYLLTHIMQLAPGILDDESTQDAISPKDLLALKKEWTTYLFNEAIKEQRISEARTLFEANIDFKFNKHGLDVLKNHYLEELTTRQYTIKQHLKLGKCALAEQLTKETVSIAEKLTIITPEENFLPVALINYAGTLIEIDKIMHPNEKDADLERLGQAQELLARCSLSRNLPRYKQRSNELLLRKIACFIEKVRTPIDFDEKYTVRKEFLPTIQPWLDLLSKNLSAFIAQNEQNPTDEMRATLAKLYYIHGDLKSFFYRNKQNDALPYFKKASELMPENPYYRLRYFELARDDRCNHVRMQLSEKSHLHMEHYTMWMLKRWNKTPVIPEEFDIHSIKPEAQGMLSRLGRHLFGT